MCRWFPSPPIPSTHALFCDCLHQSATTAEAAAKAESLRLQDELERARQAELIRLQEESVLRQEAERIKGQAELQEAQLKNAREVELARVEAEVEGRIKQERENEDVAMRKLKAQAIEERTKVG